MEWTHLPLSGGLYDQHPLFIDKCETVFEEQASWDNDPQNPKNKKGPRR